MNKRKIILCFGNSLTAGYGLINEHSYPGILQKKLDESGSSYEVVNAGISGEASRDGLNRIERYLHIPADLFILELGINDAFRRMPVNNLKSNLRQIIQKVKNKHPDVKIIIAGMQIPLNTDNNHINDINQFMKVYPDLAAEFNATLIPFFLRDVMGVRSLNLPDGLHPNKEGYEIIAETVYETIFPLLT